jgi:hypothetical protein
MLWHDLALHLGGTVEELQLRMSQGEFARWTAYVRINGPLGPARMFDRGPAMAAWTAARVAGGKAEFGDFIPRWDSNDLSDIDEQIARFFGTSLT